MLSISCAGLCFFVYLNTPGSIPPPHPTVICSEHESGCKGSSETEKGTAREQYLDGGLWSGVDRSLQSPPQSSFVFKDSIYLFESESELQGQDWPRQKLGAWSSVQVSHVDGRDSTA